jgi:hypothetical protein
MEIASAGTRRSRRASWPAALALALGLVALGVVAIGPMALAGGRQRPRGQAAFGWLSPAAVPSGWRVGVTRTRVRLAFPASWRTIQTDRGTVSAAPAGGGAFAGYLNATPRSGAETVSDWGRFRTAHLAQEGARRIRLEADAGGLRFRAARGSCVIDSYFTTRAHFREIACIVAGAHATTVVVAAAPVDRWALMAPVLERAVSSFGA